MPKNPWHPLHPSHRLVLQLWMQDSKSIFPLRASLEVYEHLLKSARDVGLAVTGAR